MEKLSSTSSLDEMPADPFNNEKQKEVEIIVTPKNGKKLKVMGNNITFSIGEISRDTMNIITRPLQPKHTPSQAQGR